MSRYGAIQKLITPQRCWQVVDIGLVIAGPLTALCFGGRHDLGRFLYTAGVLVAALGWLGASWLEGARVRLSGAHLLLGVAVTLLVIQLAPLPQPVLASISPGLSDALPLWAADNQPLFAPWETASVSPGETRLGLSLLATHAVFFIILLQRLSTLADLRKLVQFIAVITGGMAVLGIAQWFFSNGHMLWIYKHPHRNFGDHVQGTFANSNHFAHFIALGAPALVYLSVKAFQDFRGRERKRGRSSAKHATPYDAMGCWAWTGLLAIAVLAVMLAESRGGLVALAVSLVTALGLMLRHEMIQVRQKALPIAAAITGLGTIYVLGPMLLTRTVRLASAAQEGEFASEAGRQAIWDANWQAFLASPWLGWGAGCHRFFYQRFFDAPSTTVYTHAESGYLQVASETGIAGLALLAAGVLLVLSWAWRLTVNTRDAGSTLACVFVPPLIASLVHSIVDFVWYVPACVFMTAVAAAGALRLVQGLEGKKSVSEASTSTSKPHSLRALAVPAGLSVAALMAAITYQGPAAASLEWDSYLRLSKAMRKYAKTEVFANLADRQRHRQVLRHNVRQMLAKLNAVTEAHPSHPEARLQLSARNRQLFELSDEVGPNNLSALQIRDVANQSRFASFDATCEWLQAAFGERSQALQSAYRNALAATRICPTAGQPYLALAELSLFTEPSHRDHQALIEQALAVCPCDGRVLFEAGRLSQQDGQYTEAKRLWRASCRYPGLHWQTLPALMVGSGVPAETFLQEIQPPWRVFAAAAAIYTQAGTFTDRVALAQYGEEVIAAVDQTRTERETSSLWMAISDLHRDNGDLVSAIEAIRQADSLAPNRFRIRYRYAKLLIASGQLDAAEAPTRWCLARRPDLTNLQRSLAAARREVAIAMRRAPRQDVAAATKSTPREAPSNE